MSANPQILYETAGGLALFALEKKSLIDAEPEKVAEKLNGVDAARKAIRLSAFERYKDVKEATAEIASLQENRVGDKLKSFLKKQILKKGLGDSGLAVWDKQLAKAIKKKFDINVLISPAIHEIFRGVKMHADSLIDGMTEQDMKTMNVSLAHSLNRFKLKFSADKVDVMVIQAVGLLEDIDKELNNMGMRLREWYGFHFPELLKLLNDNILFAKFVKCVGYRNNLQKVSEQTFELEVGANLEVEAQIRQAAETSMGSDLVDEDLVNIKCLADRVLCLSNYRQELTGYLQKRMSAIAPNLTHMVGEVVGAKLLAQAGSLLGLAKQASSTVQILGAEKALFRALKTKSNTPKYGLLYHAQLIGQASPKLKGKISRILAAKLSLCARVDALKEVDNDQPTVAVGARAYVEQRLTALTDQAAGAAAPSPNQQHAAGAQLPKYVPSRMRTQQEGNPNTNAADQIGMPQPSVKAEQVETAPTTAEVEETKPEKKDKRKDKEGKERKHKDKEGKERKHKDKEGSEKKGTEEKEPSKKKRRLEKEAAAAA